MSALFDRRTAFLLLCLTLPLLFLPKINLLSFEGQTAGLRVDDFLLMGFALIFFWASLSLRSRMLDIEKAVMAIVLFSLISYSMNRLFVASGYLHVNASLFYCFRLLEYFLFFYIGLLAARFITLGFLLRSFILWNLFLMMLQQLQLIGVFSMEGYLPYTADHRLLGIASFGAEIGLILNLVFAYFLYEQSIKSSPVQLFPDPLRHLFRVNRPFWLLLFFAILVIFTGARIAIAALMLSFLIRLRGLMHWRNPISYIMPLMTLALGSGLITYLLFNASAIIERSEGLFSLSNLDLIPVVWKNIILDYDPIGRETIGYDSYDASWWMRIHKWCYALKIYYLHPLCWLQGVGPGFAMPALDGGILRLLTELGLIGLGLYGWFFYLVAKASVPLKWMMVTVILNMLFFDVYLAYKPMSLLFLVLGYAYQTKHESSLPFVHLISYSKV